MMIVLIVLFVLLILPVLIYFLHWKFPANKILPYFILKQLPGGKYLKGTLRRAGITFLIYSFWFLSVAILSVYCAGAYEKTILGLILEALAIVTFFLFILFVALGFYYIFLGLTSRSEYVKPGLQSAFYAEEAELHNYIRKLRIYTYINVGTLFLLIALLISTGVFTLPPNGFIILVNVVLLVTFLITIWRVREYTSKVKIVIQMREKDSFSYTLDDIKDRFFPWIDAFRILKASKGIKQTGEIKNSVSAEPHNEKDFR